MGGNTDKSELNDRFLNSKVTWSEPLDYDLSRQKMVLSSFRRMNDDNSNRRPEVKEKEQDKEKKRENDVNKRE